MGTIERDTGFNAAGKARQREVMRSLQRRLVAHLAAGKTTDFANSFMEVDKAIYTDPVRFEAEKQKMFRTLPLVACLSCDIPKPGDVTLFDSAGPSILVVRGADGKVRAFFNQCQHRMAPVVRECGNRKRLTCPFHGWTYDLTGKLVAIPGEAAFEGLDRKCISLTAVPVAEWRGLIFVKAHAGNETIDVEAYLGSLAPELAQLDIEHSEPITKTRADLKSNWKYAQDTFFEGYHFATIHPTSINAGAFSNVLVHDNFGLHERVLMASRTFMDCVGKPESEWNEMSYQAIHLIFPNTIFYSGAMERFGSASNGRARQIYGVWRIFPGTTPGESFTEMATYAAASDGPTPQEEIPQYKEVSDFIVNVIKTEDYSLCRESQKNLDWAPAGSKVMFGRNELALQSIHRNMAAAAEMPLE